MTEPEQFDVVELLVDLPEHMLRAGMQGAIVECYGDLAYEVEFTNSEGETLALVTLPPLQFILVWQAETKTWVSVAEQPVSTEHDINPFFYKTLQGNHVKMELIDKNT